MGITACVSGPFNDDTSPRLQIPDSLMIAVAMRVNRLFCRKGSEKMMLTRVLAMKVGFAIRNACLEEEVQETGETLS